MIKLNNCPHCGATAHMTTDKDEVRIACDNKECMNTIVILVGRQRLKDRIMKLIKGCTYDYTGEAKAFAEHMWNRVPEDCNE